MDRKQRFDGGSDGHGGGPLVGSRAAAGADDGPLRAFELAEAQARYEALLARAERRRLRREAAGGGRSATLLAFPPASSLRPLHVLGLDLGPRPETCQWLYGDGPFADADKCGAPAAAGQSYCLAHLPRLFLQAEDAPGESERVRR